MTSPVFIIGPPRSGTTLLAELLRLHPDVSVLTHEAHRFHHDLGRFGARVRSDDHFWLTAADAEGPIAEEYRAAVAELAGQPVIKVSTASIQVDFARAIFPDAKIVQILREPLDVIASMDDLRVALEAEQDHPRLLGPAPDPLGLAVAETFGHSRLSAAAAWFFHAVRSELDLRFAGSARVHRLRYRDLLRSPDDVLEQLLGFLELPSHPRLESALVEVSARPRGPKSLGFSTVETRAKSRLDRYAESLTPDFVQAIAPLLELPARLWEFDVGELPNEDAWTLACAHERIAPGPWMAWVDETVGRARLELERFDPTTFLYQPDHLEGDCTPLLLSGATVRHEATAGDTVATTTVFKQHRRHRFADPQSAVAKLLLEVKGDAEWRDLRHDLPAPEDARAALERLHGLGLVAF